ncbi:MAG: threonine/serine dehydratase [Chloroflexi bacterium]|nr:threonine/serine dehydratase [Chloroflexota bacterium]
MLEIPTLLDVFAARRAISPYLPPTPFQPAEALSALLGAEVWIKCENLQPVGAFKVRGGVNLVSRLGLEERARGLITASTGNHGQSIAYAGRLFGAHVVVGVPEGANPVKMAAMRALGAEVVEVGADFDEARAWVERTAAETGMRYVHPANEPLLIAGVATLSLEMIERVPDLEVVISPIGAGSGACGHCIAGKGLNPRLRVIGVQAEGAPAVWRAFHQGHMEPIDRIATFAEGLAARVPFELPLRILRERLDDLVLVSDQEIRAAMLTLIRTTRMLAEGAGAASTAAAFKLRDRLQGKRVGLVLSGGNVTVEGLREVLQDSG